MRVWTESTGFTLFWTGIGLMILAALMHLWKSL
jgi:hypothetical protein